MFRVADNGAMGRLKHPIPAPDFWWLTLMQRAEGARLEA
jgi:hypothetical protein